MLLSSGGWKGMGHLLHPRFGYPSLGEVNGLLVLAGGRTPQGPLVTEDLDIDSGEMEATVKEIEVWQEESNTWREATHEDGLGRTSLSLTKYVFSGVTFPRAWCL